MSHGASPGGRAPLGVDRRLRAKLERLGEEFLADFLGREVERHPNNVAALADLAHVLTRLGRLEEGLATDRRLVRLEPENPTVHYNLACSLALLQRIDEALESLGAAVALGYDDAEHLLADEDLVALRDDERFVDLARKLERERELL
jgi:Flp pilus assembly protein TadD